jgi:IS1 family transposase
MRIYTTGCTERPSLAGEMGEKKGFTGNHRKQSWINKATETEGTAVGKTVAGKRSYAGISTFTEGWWSEIH